MGQQESKQKGDQISQSLNKIRKDVRSGKITANDVENIQGILKLYSREIEGNRNLRASNAYTIQELIEITSQELDALKQEVNLDRATVPSNSFDHTSSKNYSKQKRKSVKSITEAVQNIRRQIRTQPLQTSDYERLQGDLANYSQVLSLKNGKKTETDAAQKLVSSVIEELLMKQSENSLRRPSSSSLKRTDRSSTSERRASWKREPRKELAVQNVTATLDDIENKLEALKSDMNVADKNRLHFLSKSVQVLMTDLQMVKTGSQPVSEERKQLLEKNLHNVFQEISRIKRQITEQNDIKYLADLQNKERKQKASQDLDDIYNGIVSIERNLNQQNYQDQKVSFLGYKEKLEATETIDEEIGRKKSEIAETVSNMDKVFTKFEMEEKLHEAEWRHFKSKLDLKEFSETAQSQVYQKHRAYLTMLRDYVDKILPVNNKVDEKKKYVLFNIENNITALDHKAEENEKVKTTEEIVLRRSLKPNTERLVNDLFDVLRKLPKSQEELSNVVSPLNEARRIIDEKLSILRNDDFQVVVVKERQVEPISSVRTQIDNRQLHLPTTEVSSQINLPPVPTKPKELTQTQIQNNLKETNLDHVQRENDLGFPARKQTHQSQEIDHLQPVQSKNDNGTNEALRHFPKAASQSGVNLTPVVSPEIDFQPPPPLITSPTNSTEASLNSTLTIQSQIRSIQQEVESIQKHIQLSRYVKDTNAYEEIKNRLETCKRQAVEVCQGSRDGDNLIGNIDNILLLLKNHATNRKSATEDILTDIISVGTRVEDLGAKICAPNLQDCDSIRNNLLEYRNYLNKIQIASSRSNLLKYRNDILHQIDQYLADLEKVQNAGSMDSEEERYFNQDLRKLKDKVNRYSGTYKNVLYKSIENDLNKHLNQVDQVFKESNVAVKVKENIEKAKMILEQKAIKEQKVEVDSNVRETGSKELTDIRQNIESVKKSLNQAEPLSKENLNKLEARLNLSIWALDNIRDEHLKKEEKEVLYHEIDFYFQKIQEMLLMAEAVVVEPQNHNILKEKQTVASILFKIKRELEEVKPNILSFVGTETSPNFLILDEILVRSTLALDEINVDQASDLYKLKYELMTDIQKFSDILDERIAQTEEVEKMEQRVKVMLIKLDSFNGYLNDSEYSQLDEELISLKIHLGKLEVSPELFTRKQTCVKEVDACLRKLKEGAKPIPDMFAGTLV